MNDKGVDDNLESNEIGELEDEFDIGFEGETMDLDKEARKKTMPLFLDSKLDKIKLDDSIFNEVIKTNEEYTPFLKTISKKIKSRIIHTLFYQI